MLASPRNSGRQGSPVAKTSGFTLVELLTVIAIIMILAGIVVGVQRGVYASQANAKAKAEVQTIATSLERYKAAHGTYPRIVANSDATADTLYNHLIGATYNKWNGSAWTTVNVAEANRRPFIDAATMTTNSRTTPTRFVDPWGMPYIYAYATTTNGNNGNFGDHFFVLSSRGSNKKPATALTDIGRFGSSALYFTNEDTRDDIVYGLEYNP